jgi:hypothetical protein
MTASLCFSGLHADSFSPSAIRREATANSEPPTSTPRGNLGSMPSKRWPYIDTLMGPAPGALPCDLARLAIGGDRRSFGEGWPSQKDKGAAAPFDCALGDRPSTGEGEWAAGCF